MSKYILDASRFHDEVSFYEELALIFELPSYFGKNLDALYDCLSEMGEPLEVTWRNHQKSKQDFSNIPGRPDFYNQVVFTFQDVLDLELRLD